MKATQQTSTTLTIEQLVLCISRITDAIKRNGYNANVTTVKLLTTKILKDFGIARLWDLNVEGLADFEMYIEQWKPSSCMKFYMRDHKQV
jgi:hypothetical protein